MSRVAPFTIREGDWTSVRKAIQKIGSYGIGPTSSPTFAGLTINGDVYVHDILISTPSNVYLLNHDSFAGFVALEHIDHSAVNIVAGTGMSGGGTISVSRTLDCTITQYTDELAQDAVGTILSSSASISLIYVDATPIIQAEVKPAGVDHDALNNFVTLKHVDHSAVNITAGTGMSGGGSLSVSRTLNCTISQYTDEMAQDTIGAILTCSDSSISINYDDATNFIRLNAVGGGGTVKVDVAATADYIGASLSVGVLRTSTGLTKTDGGDFVTLAATGLLGDGTAGRVFRIAQLTIANGTNANTVKCTLASIWNGDVIAATDNIAKNATTGNYYLSLGGTDLRILGTGITGDPLTAFNNLAYNDTGTGVFTTSKYEATPSIEVNARNATTGTAIDWTSLVDGGGGTVVLFILYLTTT